MPIGQYYTPRDSIFTLSSYLRLELSRIFLKLENLQPSGSFKSRGIGNLVLQALKTHEDSGDDRPIHFYASSGGNAGLACVAAANALGCSSTIVVPTSTEESTVARLWDAGASQVFVHGSNWSLSDGHMRNIVMPQAGQKGEVAVYVPPFDHHDIWSGVSTIIPELKRQLPSEAIPDAIVCSVGGGGLLSGIMTGLIREGWSTQVLAIETAGADSLAQSVQQKTLVALPEITSIATSLGAPMVAQQALSYALRGEVSSVVVDDSQACESSWRFADDERILIEPACGASLALVYGGQLERYVKGFSSDSIVVIVACGGSRITLDAMQDYKQRFGGTSTAG